MNDLRNNIGVGVCLLLLSGCSASNSSEPGSDAGLGDGGTGNPDVGATNGKQNGPDSATPMTTVADAQAAPSTPDSGLDAAAATPPIDARSRPNMPDAGSDGDASVPTSSTCGNGNWEALEACDDGNQFDNDGCSADCASVEEGFICPVANMPCMPVCGDGILIAPEECDDFNAVAGDGCSDACMKEEGFDCPLIGACTPTCGDGRVVAGETCDDGNSVDNDGCTSSCSVMEGYACYAPGFTCLRIPDCPPFGGECSTSCGDGLITGAETCDDGNTADGDGCSASCTVESGFTCPNAPAIANQFVLPVTYRDFVSASLGDPPRHPDFQAFTGDGATFGIVEDYLGLDGLPVYTGLCETGSPNLNTGTCPYGQQTTTQANFDQWYRDTLDVNLRSDDVLVLDQVGNTNSYRFVDNLYLPLTGRGWDSFNEEALISGGNYGYTSEIRLFFRFNGDDVIEIESDDDLWVFINGQLIIDQGGVSGPLTESVTLNVATGIVQLNMTVGEFYEIVILRAERRAAGSNFSITLTGFQPELGGACVPN